MSLLDPVMRQTDKIYPSMLSMTKFRIIVKVKAYRAVFTVNSRFFIGRKSVPIGFK